MGSIDDLPKRDSTHDTAGAAEAAFEAVIEAGKLFTVQQKDRRDYGTDAQIEARHSDSMTNLRAHVQIKGTETAANADGSVSIEVARTNLNYLLAQSDSIYICYHIPTRRLMVRYALDVYRDYEHRGKKWLLQDQVTIRFAQLFDDEFQRRLNARIIASGNSTRDRRLEWAVTPPERLTSVLKRAVPDIHVPADPGQAWEVLATLYDAGEDAAISKAFPQFAAVLTAPGAMDLAYMAEINLAITGEPFDEVRVREAIQTFEDALARGGIHPGSLLYCQGNGWLVLREWERARETYRAALVQLEELPNMAAMCSKNMGSALAALGEIDEARRLYERALELDPDLGEAHLALAQWHRLNGDLPGALEHLDRVIRQRGSSLPMYAIAAWRIEVLFEIGNIDGAFRDVQILLGNADRLDWVWPWCARQVARFGTISVDSAHKAVRFWRAYLQEHPDNGNAQRELLLCLWFLRAADAPTGTNFEEFKLATVELIRSGDPDAAFLWDRVGHWAQYDENWAGAEQAYRKAYEIEPERYGYCLGTALNFLGRYGEALPILLCQAEEHLADAKSWFQVARAREGVGEIEGSIAAYKKALELDPDYDLAWFNLGGLYWNSQDILQAAATWREAVAHFPDHDLARELRRDMPFLFQ